MADSDYDVGGRVVIDEKQAMASMRRLSTQLTTVGSQLRSTQSLASNLFSKAIGFGAAYVGFNAVTGAISRAAHGMFQFQKEIIGTKIGLASVFSAVQGISFEKAQNQAAGVYKELSEDAIKSVATTKELFDIYSGIVGPIYAAGFGLEKVRDMTRDTVNASAALGVDFPQAKRDIAAMARGAAGMDVKMFQTMRSMGLIKEDAKAFNALTQNSRIEKLAAALKKAGVGAEAYGNSLPGRISTFVDIVGQLGASFSGPVFEILTERLGKVNDYLLANKDGLMSYLENVGTRVGFVVESVFTRLGHGFQYVTSHWDEIVAKVQETVARMAELVPQLAKGYLAVSLGRDVLGYGLTGAGMVTGAAAKLGAGGVAEAAAAAAGTKAASAAIAGGMLAMPGRYGVGGGLLSTQSAAPVASSVYSPAALSSSGLFGGEASAATAATAASATPAIVALSVALVGFAAIGYTVADQWDSTKLVLGELLKPLDGVKDKLLTVGLGLWNIARPLVRLVGGGLFMLVTTSLSIFAHVVETLVTPLSWAVEWVGKLGTAIDDWLKPALGGMFTWIAQKHAEVNTLLYGPKPLHYSGDDIKGGTRGGRYSVMPAAGGMPKTPGVRPSIVQDFRGSKFQIKQDFRDADPDRVLRVMLAGLEKVAERRTQSAYVPAFSR